MIFHVYILRCSDGSYYVGSTHDLQMRIKAHNEGKAALFTSIRLPVELVYSEVHENESSAVQRERQIKRWSRAKKEALISGHKDRLKQLSEKRK